MPVPVLWFLLRLFSIAGPLDSEYPHAGISLRCVRFLWAVGLGAMRGLTLSRCLNDPTAMTLRRQHVHDDGICPYDKDDS